jgi:hypothetical protein
MMQIFKIQQLLHCRSKQNHINASICIHQGIFQQYEEHKPRSFVVWGIQHEETNQTTTFLNNTKDICMYL